MSNTLHPHGMGRRMLSATTALACLLAGCKARNQEVYQDGDGFRFVAPPGWVERVPEEKRYRRGWARDNRTCPYRRSAVREYNRNVSSCGTIVSPRVSMPGCG